MNEIIQILNFSKKFGEVVAVKDVSFSVKEGEMFGLVGPDGAGKTTTIKALCGLLSPAEGTIKLFGESILEKRSEIQKQIGYLSQRFNLYEDLSVDENIEFFAEIHDVRNYKKRRDELLEFTRLKPFRARLAENLSGGMKQKLALACSLIHSPKILFLDEPTTGVDPLSRRDFWKILMSLIAQGITIVMTTPYLDEAERCNRVALMDKGKILMLDNPHKIRSSIGRKIFEIVSPNVREIKEFLFEKFGYEVHSFGDRIDVVIEEEKETERILKELSENKFKILNKRIKLPSLENVFIYLLKKEHRGLG